VTAQLIQFPRAKKRGAKVRKGPLCEFHELPRESRRTVGGDDEVVNRMVDKLEDAFSNPRSEMGAMLRNHIARNRQAWDSEKRRQFVLWRQGGLISANEYAAGSCQGIATDHFGEGPDAFRWAVKDTEGEAYHAPFDRDRAMRAAIECLNTIAHAVRYGALQARSSPIVRDGFDKEAAGAYAQGVLSTLGRTVELLREFGGGVDPA